MLFLIFRYLCEFPIGIGKKLAGGLNYYKMVNMELKKIKKFHVLNIAVLDFQNKDNNAEYDYFSNTIPESIGTFLLKEKKVNLLTGKRIESLMEGYTVEPAKIEDKAELRKIAERIGAEVVITGTFQAGSGKVSIRNILYYSESDTIEFVEDYKGKIDLTVFDLLDRVSSDNLKTIQEKILK